MGEMGAKQLPMGPYDAAVGHLFLVRTSYCLNPAVHKFTVILKVPGLKRITMILLTSM